MSLKRRLISLECRPFMRPSKKEDPRIMRRAQKFLALPLPEYATSAEAARTLELMKAAQKFPAGDATGWIAVREYALSMHRKYGTTPYWGSCEDKESLN
jgi:hypothetical protein